MSDQTKAELVRENQALRLALARAQADLRRAQWWRRVTEWVRNVTNRNGPETWGEDWVK